MKVKFLLILCAVVFMCVKSNAQSARVEKVWLEHDSNNGNGLLKIHIKLHTEDMKGQQGTVCVFFYHGDSKLMDKDNKCCSSDGQVAIYKSITPRYDSSVYDDLCLTIQGYDLHIPTSYVDEYSLQLGIYHSSTKKFLTHSKYVKFYAKSQIEICVLCGGSGLCIGCNGMGLIGIYPYQQLCYMCKGARACPCCRGSRQVNYSYTYASMPSNSVSPGYTGNAGFNTIPQPIQNMGNNNTYNSSGSNTRSTRRTCPGCNGTGKGPDRVEYAPNYTGQDNSRYCSKCGRTMPAHVHIQGRCTVCYGKGYVD